MVERNMSNAVMERVSGMPRSLLKMAKRSLPLDDYAAFVC